MDEIFDVKIENINNELKRINKRLEVVETTQATISEIVTDIKVMTTEMTHMREAQGSIQTTLNQTNSRLDELEKKPLKFIDTAHGSAINSVVGIIIGALVIGTIWLITTHGGM